MFAGDFSDSIKRSRDLGRAERDVVPIRWGQFGWCSPEPGRREGLGHLPVAVVPNSKYSVFALFSPLLPEFWGVLHQLEELKRECLFFQLTFGAVETCEMPHRWVEKPPSKTKNPELNELQRSKEMLQETMQKPAFDSLPKKKIKINQKHKKKVDYSF